MFVVSLFLAKNVCFKISRPYLQTVFFLYQDYL